jgi:D-alanine-D-alanine ligase
MERDLPATLVLYNEPRRADDGQALESETGVLDEVKAVIAALEHLGIAHRALSCRTLSDVPWVVASASEPVVFNLVEGFWDGPADAAHVPTVLRALNKRFTGNDSAAQILGLDKWKTKALLRCNGIPTPEAVRVALGDKVPENALPWPRMIVKPADTDASEGIHPSSIIQAPGPLVAEKVAWIHEMFGQAALVEQYIDGRELNVSLMEFNGQLEVLPIAEIDFGAFDQNRPRIVDYAAKWEKGSFAYENTPRLLPAPLPTALAEEIRELCRRTWRAMGLSGYARIDLRLDEQNRPYILEANPNPDISLDAGFAAALEAAGVAYHEFVRLAVVHAQGAPQPKPRVQSAVSSRQGKTNPAAGPRPRSGHPDSHGLLQTRRARNRHRGVGRCADPGPPGTLSIRVQCLGERRGSGLDLLRPHTMLYWDLRRVLGRGRPGCPGTGHWQAHVRPCGAGHIVSRRVVGHHRNLEPGIVRPHQ